MEQPITITLDTPARARLIPTGFIITLPKGTRLCVADNTSAQMRVHGDFGEAFLLPDPAPKHPATDLSFDTLPQEAAGETPQEAKTSDTAASPAICKTAPAAKQPDSDGSKSGETQQPLQNPPSANCATTATQPAPTPAAKTPPEKFETPPNLLELKADLEKQAWSVAKTVFDPEIPVNIVDLGLIYKLDLCYDGKGSFFADCDMTLTAPGCAMGPAIAEKLQSGLLTLPNISGANINIVWDPPWNQDMMSEEARMILGLE